MLDWPLFLLRLARDKVFHRLGHYRPPGSLQARYLSQVGLALACDACGSLPYVVYGTETRPELLDLSTYLAVPDGGTIYIRIEDLHRFNQQVLPRLGRFVLVTGESDYSVPSDFPEDVARTLASGRVIRWYTTNFDGDDNHDVMRSLPLGLHHATRTDWMGLLHPNGPTRVDARPFDQQEASWDAISSGARPLADRIPRAVADFHLNNTSRSRRFGESRADIHEQLKSSPCITWLPRNQRLPALLADYARHAFVISPHGRGLDCYRTWEALLMGCVPIVKRSPLDRLYHGLPVAIVDDWREITPASLARWTDEFGPAFDRTRLHPVLSCPHWIEQIRDDTSSPPAPPDSGRHQAPHAIQQLE